MSKTPFILYVAKDNNDSDKYCKGSTVCINMMKTIPKDYVTIQDTNVLMDAQTLPEWLNGTPILVDTTNMTIFKGSDAIFQLSVVVQEVGGTDTTHKSDSISNTVNKTNKQVDKDENVFKDSSNKIGDIDDVFSVDVDAQERAKNANDEKVTTDDLQKLLETRNRLIKKSSMQQQM